MPPTDPQKPQPVRRGKRPEKPDPPVRIKFTEAELKKQKPPTDKDARIVWDTVLPNFGQRISKTGRRVSTPERRYIGVPQ
jgi:hypothetical protein